MAALSYGGPSPTERRLTVSGRRLPQNNESDRII